MNKGLFNPRTAVILDRDMPKFVWLDGEVVLTGVASPGFADLSWGPFLEDIEDYLSRFPQQVFPKDEFVVHFKLETYNTSSSKFLSNILSKLQSLSDRARITWKWYVYEDDEDEKSSIIELYHDSRLYPNIKIEVIDRPDTKLTNRHR